MDEPNNENFIPVINNEVSDDQPVAMSLSSNSSDGEEGDNFDIIKSLNLETEELKLNFVGFGG